MSNDYLVERRIRQHKLRRKARRGEIAFRRIYKFVRFIFIIFIFYALYRLSAASLWYLPQDIYTNPGSNRIEIMGNSIVSSKKIISEMQKVPLEKKPIYKINPAETARIIEQLQPIKRAYVRRYWLPSRLVVMVEEIIPAIVIAPTEDSPALAAYAITGEFISKEYLPLNENIKTIKILSYGTQGDDYTKWDVEKINDLYNIAALTQEYSGEKVSYIDLRQPHNIFIQLESVKIRLGELDKSAFERIKSIHDIMPELKAIKENIRYIDLSWKESKYIKLNK